MAEKPLFYSDTETLSRLLRLQNLGGGTTGSEILDHAVLESHTTFWKELGSSAISTLQGLIRTVPPVTDDDFKRLLAEQIEFDVVKYHLAAHLPLAYKDGRADFIATYNTEGAFRVLPPRQMADLRSFWWNDRQRGIAYRFKILRGEDTVKVALAGHDSVDESAEPVLLYTTSYYRPQTLLDLTKLGLQVV